MTPDEEIVVFHYQLGVAITQWSSVEAEIAAIILAFFPNKQLNHESLSVGFLSLESTRAKMDFAEQLVSRKLFGTPYLDEWKQLTDQVRKASRKRNKLAHWQLGKFWERPVGRRVALIPWVYKKPTKKTKVPSPPQGSLHIRNFSEFSAEFYALARDLNNFRRRLCALPELPSEDDAQAPHPQSAPTIGRQIREVLSAPPPPSSRKHK